MQRISYDNITMAALTSEGNAIPRFLDVGNDWVYDFRERRYLRLTELLQFLDEGDFYVGPGEFNSGPLSLYDHYDLPYPLTRLENNYISGAGSTSYVFMLEVDGDTALSDGTLRVHVKTSEGVFTDEFNVTTGDSISGLVATTLANTITVMDPDLTAANNSGEITITAAQYAIETVLVFFQDSKTTTAPPPPPPDPVFTFTFDGQYEDTNNAVFSGYDGTPPYTFNPGNGGDPVIVPDDATGVLYDYQINGGYIASLTDSSDPPVTLTTPVFLDWHPITPSAPFESGTHTFWIDLEAGLVGFDLNDDGVPDDWHGPEDLTVHNLPQSVQDTIAAKRTELGF